MSYEVDIRITFIEPCLGNERQPDPTPNMMRKDQNGNVTFQQVWWRTILQKAAEAYSKHQKRVKCIVWSPEVDGTVKIYKRQYKKRMTDGTLEIRYKKHEAFCKGDTVGIKALLPNDISIEDFREILTIAGKYYGISPFGWRKGYGKFQVVGVERVYGRKQDSGDDKEGQPSFHQAEQSNG